MWDAEILSLFAIFFPLFLQNERKNQFLAIAWSLGLSRNSEVKMLEILDFFFLFAIDVLLIESIIFAKYLSARNGIDTYIPNPIPNWIEQNG